MSVPGKTMQSEDESSDISSESLNSDAIEEETEKKFFITMSLLMSKDKDKIQKIKEINSELPDTHPKDNKNSSTSKPVYLKEYQSKILFQSGGNPIEEVEENSLFQKKLKKSNEDKAIINEIISETEKCLSDASEMDCFFKPCEKTTHQIEKSENDYVDWLKGSVKDALEIPSLKDLEHLKKKWDDVDKNEAEAFLKDYILNKKYLFSNLPKILDTNANSAIKDESTKVELKPVSYPRKIEGSSRSCNLKRVEKRKLRQERKLIKKRELFNKLKDVKIKKKKEIMEKIRSLEQITGENPAKKKDYEEYGFEEEEEQDNDELKVSKRNLKKLKRIEKAKNKIKTKLIDLDEKHDDLLDEYYNVNYEDVIDDTPVRYNYRSVLPNSYGLTPEEILLCDEKELNQWCPLRRVVGYNDENSEWADIKRYTKKTKSPSYKKALLSSLYEKSQSETPTSSTKKENAQLPVSKHENNKNVIAPSRRKMLQRYFKGVSPHSLKRISLERLQAYGSFKGKK